MSQLLLGGGPLADGPLDLDRRGDAVVELLLAFRVGRERSVDAAVDLLVDAWHTEHDLRVHLFQVVRELTGVRAAVHAEADDEGLVVARHPLGDVRHREVRHDPHPGVVIELKAFPELLDRVDDVVLADHHALRRSRGAARVDQRGDVGGVGRGGERGEVGAAVRLELRRRCHPVGQIAIRLDDVDPAQPRQFAANLEESGEKAGVLDDRDLGTGVAGEVLDLLRRRRVVDADRRRPQELGGQVEAVELRTIAHHEEHAVASGHSVGLESGRDPGHRRLDVADAADVPAAPVRHRVQQRQGRIGRRQLEKSSWHRAAGHEGVDLGD